MDLSKWSGSLAIARRMLPHLAPHRLRMLGVGALSLGIAALEMLRPWPIKWIFDGALMPAEGPAASPERIIWAGALAAAAIFGLRAVTQYVRDVQLAGVRHQFTRELRTTIFRKLSQLPPAFHSKHKSGDLLVRLMGDAPMVSTMMVESSTELATRGLLIAGTVGIMVYLDALLTLVVLAAIPVLLLVVGWLSRQITIAVRKQRRKEGELADYLHEAISATDLIQSLGSTDEVVRRFARNNRRDARAGLKAKRLAARLSASVESLLGVATAGALLLGSMRVVSGDLTPGELLVFLSYVRSLLKPVRSAAKHAERIAKGTACGERILTILDEEQQVRSLPGAVPAPERPEELVFENVGYSYDGRSPALEGLSARFRRGELTALVGRNGAGKTTLASLGARLFDPDRGEIRLDGTPLPQLELDSLRRCTGLCMQRSTLFGETVRENLLLAVPEAEEEALWRALDQAGASEFVTALPDGLDTALGAGGAGLSGGQTHRISLARTLLRDASVLVVDEPFAGLDHVAIRQVRTTLKQLAEERIVIVIAHDLDDLGLFDRVLFLDGGRAGGAGTHDELLKACPAYRSVVAAPDHEGVA